MAKRLTATDKWDDPWFFKLSKDDKLFWIYVCDKCSHAGIWQVNWEVVKTYIKGYRFNAEVFQGRIMEIAPEKWFIKKFVGFQYGTLNPSNRAHASVLIALEKEGASKGLASPMLGPKDKDKEKEKDKDKEKVKDKERHLDFVMLTAEEHQKLKTKLGSLLDSYLQRLNGYIGQIGQQKAASKYSSHYHTILNWHHKDAEEGKLHGTNVSQGIPGLDPEAIRAAGYRQSHSGLRKVSSPGAIFDGIRNLPVLDEDRKPESEKQSGS